MSMKQSNIEIRSVLEGLELVSPDADSYALTRAHAAAQHVGQIDGNILLIDQTQHGDAVLDRQDRIQVVIRLVRELQNAGL